MVITKALPLQDVLHQYLLHQISYCADDKAEKRFFSFIAKEGDSDIHSCFVFISDKLAEEITLTIGQAFDLAYRRFLETSTKEVDLRRQVVSLQHQLITSQQEIASLKQRMTQIIALKNRDDVDSYMVQNGVRTISTFSTSTCRNLIALGLVVYRLVLASLIFLIFFHPLMGGFPYLNNWQKLRISPSRV